MRVKHSVDFRMAPKKASKGKVAVAEPTHGEGWNTSKCSKSDLETLVSAGLLVPRSVVQWRPSLGKDHWGFLVLFSSLGSGAITGSSSTI